MSKRTLSTPCLGVAAVSLLLWACDRPGPLPTLTPVEEVGNTVYPDDPHDRHRAMMLLHRSQFEELQALAARGVGEPEGTAIPG